MVSYKSQYFRYKLDDKELNLIDKTWDFIELFTKRFLFLEDYRDYIIKKIRKKYTPEEFYQLETIANKLFWNMRWMLYPFWKNQRISKSEYDGLIKSNFGDKEKLPQFLTLCNHKTYRNDEDLFNKIDSLKMSYAGSFYRSFINKIFVVDTDEKIIYHKPMEGSAMIFSKNYFNLLTSHLMMNRSLYEKVLNDPFQIRRINVPISEYYQQFDYGFPNLNYCVYSVGSKKDKLRKIKKMYFYQGKKIDSYWFKVIV